MRQLLTISFLLIILSSFGQTCDTVKGQLINCTDSTGRRQGYWEIKKKKIINTSNSGYGSKEGCQYSENVEYIPVSEGQYKDNKKIGTWKYYGDNDHLLFVEKTIAYYDNGSTLETNLLEKSVIELNKDSSVIKGRILYKGDSIHLICTNKMCVFKLKPDKEVISFDYVRFNKFDSEFLRLKIGMYDRKIKAIKTNR